MTPEELRLMHLRSGDSAAADFAEAPDAHADRAVPLDEVDRLMGAMAEAEAARQLLIEANPLIFGSDGTVDHDLPLLAVARSAAEKIEHLRRLHGEAVGHCENLYMEFHRDTPHREAAVERWLMDYQEGKIVTGDCKLIVDRLRGQAAEAGRLRAALEQFLAIGFEWGGSSFPWGQVADRIELQAAWAAAREALGGDK